MCIRDRSLNDWLHALEDAHGRDRSGPRFNDRTLDIDIVFYDDLVMQGTGNLRIPRDELRHAFVLKPLADIAPDFVDPTSGKALATLWKAHPEHGRELEAVSYTHLDVYKRQAFTGYPIGMDKVFIEGCLLYTSRCV